jgi:hypothetical protein
MRARQTARSFLHFAQMVNIIDRRREVVHVSATVNSRGGTLEQQRFTGDLSMRVMCRRPDEQDKLLNYQDNSEML